MQRVNLEVYGETCCDLCNEIIHNHLDCPGCGGETVGSENYGDLEKDDILTCDCGAKFKLLSDHWYGGCEAEWLNAPVEENGHTVQKGN